MADPESKKVFNHAREQAIAFYDAEHTLQPEDRRQLHVVFEQQFRRMMLLSSVGFAAGVGLPFLLRKKGKLMGPGLPIFGGIIGSSFLPALFNQTIFDRQVATVEANYGTESQIYKTLQVTPFPVTKSFFWSNYFKTSAEDPSIRITDPRLVEDMNTPLVQRKPVSEQITGNSSWDDVRRQEAAIMAEGQQQQQQPRSELEDDPFEFKPEEPVGNIGDSYDQDGPGVSVGAGTGSGTTSVSAWDRVRKESK